MSAVDASQPQIAESLLPMHFIPTTLPEVIIVEPPVFGDQRGFFMETYQQRKFAEAGIDATFVQDNHSGSQQAALPDPPGAGQAGADRSALPSLNPAPCQRRTPM